MVKMIR